MQRVQRFAEIDAPVEIVFDRFSDFESVPRWMRNINRVRRTGRRTSRWVCETAMPELYAEWDAEVTVFEPDRRIVWRSVRGDIRTDGEAVFSTTPYGTTLLRLVIGYDTPLGRTGEQASRFFGVHPGEQLAEDLEHFKRMVERESAGRSVKRGVERARPFAPTAPRREGTRHASAERRPPQSRASSDDGERRRAQEGTGEIRRRRDSEFESEREGRRRVEARDREEEPRRREERDARARAEEEREYRPRYALTPRERERERGQERRSFDPGVSELFTRRGVDRLVEDPPSRRWRERERE